MNSQRIGIARRRTLAVLVGLVISCAALCAALCAAPPASALEQPAPANDEILNLLPGQPLAVFRGTGLGDAWQWIKGSGIAARFDQAPPGDVAAKMQDIRNGLAQLQINSGVNAEELLVDLIGNDCAVALYGGNEGVFVSVSHDSTQMKEAVDKVMTLERAWGRVQGENAETYQLIEIHQTTFTNQRRPDAPGSTRFHCCIDKAIVVSSNLDTIKKVIDLAQKKERTPESKEMVEAFTQMDRDAVVRAYVDADGLSQKVDLETALNGKIRHPGVRMLVKQLKAVLPLVKYATFTATPKDDRLELRGTFLYDEQALPETLLALLPRPDCTLDVLQLAPESSVLCAGHQVNKAALWRYIIETVQQSNPRQAQRIQNGVQWVGAMIGGLNFEQQLLPQIGDQIGVLVTSRDAPDAAPVLSLVMELKGGQDIPTAIRTLAGTAAGIAQLEASKTQAEPKAVLEKSTYKDVEFTTVKLTERKFAGNVNPTLFVIDNMMILSSNVDGGHAIVDRHAAGKKDLAKALTLPKYDGTLIGAGKLDLRKVNEILLRHKDFLVADAARKGKPQEIAEKELEGLMFLIGLMDNVTFYSTQVPGRIDRVALVKFAKDAEEPAAPVAK